MAGALAKRRTDFGAEPSPGPRKRIPTTRAVRVKGTTSNSCSSASETSPSSPRPNKARGAGADLASSVLSATMAFLSTAGLRLSEPSGSATESALERKAEEEADAEPAEEEAQLWEDSRRWSMQKWARQEKHRTGVESATLQDGKEHTRPTLLGVQVPLWASRVSAGEAVGESGRWEEQEGQMRKGERVVGGWGHEWVAKAKCDLQNERVHPGQMMGRKSSIPHSGSEQCSPAEGCSILLCWVGPGSWVGPGLVGGLVMEKSGVLRTRERVI